MQREVLTVESKVTCGFLTAWGSAALTPALLESRLSYEVWGGAQGGGGGEEAPRLPV